MTRIVLDIRLTDTNVIKELWILLIAKFRAPCFVLRKKYKATKQALGLQEKYTDLCVTVDVWITVSFLPLVPVMYRMNILEEEQRNARFLAV